FISAFNVLADGDRHFAGDEELHDESHIKQHLEDKIDVSKLSEEQQRFHYFSISDLNKDNLIDGNEILKALTHDHSDDTGPGVPIQDEEAMIQMVDGVLADMDINGDGYIEFAEYMKKTGKSARSS
ncbi:EF hand, partial [Ostertagia ostertagi]